jgi:hypothetical protein
MITWKMVLLAIYLTVAIGIFIMNALYVSDLKKFRDEKLKEGVRFKPCPRVEKVASWVRLIISAVLPLWNLLVLYTYIWQAERVLANAKQDLLERAIEE